MRRATRLILTIVVATGCAYAQSGIEVPSIGMIVDSSGTLRSVQGVAGNFLMGAPAVSGVLSAACSDRVCLVKTDSKILSTTGETAAPPGPAIFSVDREEALVYFPGSRAFARWRDNTLVSLDWTVDGEVLSIRIMGDDVEFAVRRDHTVWIVHPDASVIDSIADAPGPVLLLPDAVLFATANEIVLIRHDSTDVRLEFTEAESVAAMGPNYAAIHAGNAVYALRTEPGRESIFLLPGSSP